MTLTDIIIHHMNYSNYLRILFAVFLSVANLPASFAQTIPLFVSADAITLLTHIGKTQSVTLVNHLGNTYVDNKHWDNQTTMMFGAGATTYQKHHMLFNTGLRYLNTSGILSQGSIWQLNQPQFNNLAYSYRVTTDLILLENMTSYAKHLIQPSFILGLGYALNTAYDYQTTPLYNHASRALQTFRDQKKSALAYEVGGGLDYYILKPAVLALAYRFMAAGKAELGTSPLQNTTHRISTGNIYFHTISFGIRLYYDHTY